ncbi:MAG: UvrD-helicase domain-containing protein, partial [Rhodoluna sp.]
MSVAQGSFDGMTEMRFKSPTAALRIAAEDLSASQQAVAALNLNGIATVYGAPGTGKTTAIKALFSNAMKSLKPSQILVLAANRESANALRDELALGFQGATPGPLARTLTSFAFSILRLKALREGQALPELISGSEQDRILAQVIADVVADGLPPVSDEWPAQFNQQVIELSGFRAELRDLITVCLEHGLNVEEMKGLAAKHGKPEWAASALFFERYLATVSAFEGRFDASSLLRIASQWLASQSEWPAELREIQTVIVDDAQELTPAAMRLLRAVTGTTRGLILVGDPDSSTLGFRAADPRAMAALAGALAADRGSEVETIFLES